LTIRSSRFSLRIEHFHPPDVSFLHRVYFLNVAGKRNQEKVIMLSAARLSWLFPILATALLACTDEPDPGGGTGGSSSGSGGSSGSGAGVSGSSPAGTSGSAGSGGSASAGMSGSSATAGSAGSAGSSGSGGSATSDGCGSPTTLKSGTFNIDVDGTEREYILSMPENYDPEHPYKLIFGFHWRGANAIDIENNDFYGLRNSANDTAIFVSPDSFGEGWTNSGGEDIAFTLALVNYLKAEACVDESRIFSLGFSYGGMMSFAVGCALGDVFRAIAPFAGALYSGCEDGTAPVAMWGAHGYSNGGDGVVPIANGREGRDVFLERNGCSDETVMVQPDECVAYQGCKAGYPVTWCEWDGGHSTPSFATKAVWDFFSQF
jgi:poly(3-hydroxybutyrate) depolymerase